MKAKEEHTSNFGEGASRRGIDVASPTAGNKEIVVLSEGIERKDSKRRHEISEMG